jgi:hypothetical protein
MDLNAHFLFNQRFWLGVSYRHKAAFVGMIEFAVTPNTTLKLFAGNYRDQVASLTIKKGVIITKNYFIKIKI